MQAWKGRAVRARLNDTQHSCRLPVCLARRCSWQIAIAMIIVPSALITINALFMKDTPISLLERAPCLVWGSLCIQHVDFL